MRSDGQLFTSPFRLSWISVGSNSNHIYVTGASAPGAFETVLDLGCKGAAGERPRNVGDAADEETSHERRVADGVWGMFAGRETKRVDGVVMKYNHDIAVIDPITHAVTMPAAALTASDMLAHPQGKGECAAWADLLFLALKAQGLWASTVQTLPKPGAELFVVNAMPAQGTGASDYTARREFASHMMVRIDTYGNRIYEPG